MDHASLPQTLGRAHSTLTFLTVRLRQALAAVEQHDYAVKVEDLVVWLSLANEADGYLRVLLHAEPEEERAS